MRPDASFPRVLRRLLAALCLIGAVAVSCTPAPSPTAPAPIAEAGEDNVGGNAPKPTQGRDADRNPTPRPIPASSLQPSSEVVLDGVLLPAALSFAPDGRLFFVEVNAGRIRVASGRQLQEEPFATLPVQQASESGLLGLAIDPDFARNRYVHAFYSEPHPSKPEQGVRNRVVRFTERDGIGTDMTAILGDLPNNRKGGVLAHQGGAMAFGPDGKLYVTIGDTGRAKRQEPQDPASLAGKVLRVNPDGSIPADNPFPGSPVFALGFRNPWGIAFHPKTGALFATENGDLSHDEVNLVRAGGNYGWPLAEGAKGDPRFVDPVWDSGPGKASRHGMVGLTFYNGTLFPELQDELLFCHFKDGSLYRVPLEPPRHDRFGAISRLAKDCRLSVSVGPEGAIYYSSVNQIMRLVP